jgi:uncharacterized protein
MKVAVMRLDVTQLLREPVGTHTDVEFNLGPQYLEDLPVNSIRGRLTLLRAVDEVLVRGILNVDVTLECGRCLTPTSSTLQIELDERFRPVSLGTAQDNEEVLVIDADNQLDLRPILKDLVIISTPMHVVCRPECLGLCPDCGQNLNEGSCDCQSDDIDPRLLALKALIKS